MMPISASLAPEGRGDRDAVEHRVDGDAGQQLLLARAECRASRRSRASPGSTSSRLFSSGFFFGAE